MPVGVAIPIYVGDALRLMNLPDSADMRNSSALSGFLNTPLEYTRRRDEPLPNHPSAQVRLYAPRNLDEQQAFRILAELEANASLLSATAGGGLNAFGHLVGQGNDALISDISDIYQQYKDGDLSKGQYDYRRRNVLKELSRRMGPFADRIMQGPPNVSLRINRHASVPVTFDIERHAARLSRLSSYARTGGIVLAGVGVTMACKEIANTDDQHEKNEIMVETVMGTLVSVGGGIAVTLFLASNPVGWVLAIGLGVGTAAAGFATGKGARYWYNTNEKKIDLVSMSGIDTLCK